MITWKRLATIVLLVGASFHAYAGDGAQPTSRDRFEEAKALATNEDWRDAIARFREFLRSNIDDPRASEARFWIGFCLIKSAEYFEAVVELAPFEAELAKDKWADDALLQLGRAHRGKADSESAIAAWKRLVEKYPDSVWRIEAELLIIESLYNAKHDYEACLGYCEQVAKETVGFTAITEARYAGAACLNALGRFDEADRWMNRWFAPDAAVEAAWRGVLGAQRELSKGRTTEAFAIIASLFADYPDLDGDSRFDLILRTASMLTRENQGARARTLLLDTLRQSSERSEADILAILDGIEATTSDTDPFQTALDRLATEISLPLMVRVVVRDRQVKALRELKSSNQAEALLRGALTKEKAEYARFRAAMLLANLLSVDRGHAEAATMLKGILPTLRRFDLVNRVRDEIERLQPTPEKKTATPGKTKP